MDENERVLVFLRHRDCNNLDALGQHDMDPEMIRKAILGAMRSVLEAVCVCVSVGGGV